MEPLRLRVITSRKPLGRLVEDPAGRIVDVTVDVDRAKAEKLILSILSR